MKITSGVITYLIVSAVLTGLFASPSFVKTSLGGEVKGADITSPHSRTIPLIDTFKALYEEATLAVSEGKLSEEVGEEADDLWISLQKYMIHTDARIETLKLEAREYEGAKQEEALDQLVKVGAERERTLMKYIQALEKLADRQTISKPLSQETGDIPDPEKAARDFEEGKKEEPAEYADP
ncbi:MAG: hypothetical protein GTO08_04250, partial [Deltaproteobacteria bacterium]|nr:hypothetical protein [Deltaproteobacteria bacterium]